MDEKAVKSPQEVEGQDGIPLDGQGESHQRHRVARNRKNTTAARQPFQVSLRLSRPGI